MKRLIKSYKNFDAPEREKVLKAIDNAIARNKGNADVIKELKGRRNYISNITLKKFIASGAGEGFTELVKNNLSKLKNMLRNSGAKITAEFNNDPLIFANNASKLSGDDNKDFEALNDPNSNFWETEYDDFGYDIDFNGETYGIIIDPIATGEIDIVNVKKGSIRDNKSKFPKELQEIQANFKPDYDFNAAAYDIETEYIAEIDIIEFIEMNF